MKAKFCGIEFDTDEPDLPWEEIEGLPEEEMRIESVKGMLKQQFPRELYYWKILQEMELQLIRREEIDIELLVAITWEMWESTKIIYQMLPEKLQRQFLDHNHEMMSRYIALRKRVGAKAKSVYDFEVANVQIDEGLTPMATTSPTLRRS